MYDQTEPHGSSASQYLLAGTAYSQPTARRPFSTPTKNILELRTSLTYDISARDRYKFQPLNCFVIILLKTFLVTA